MERKTIKTNVKVDIHSYGKKLETGLRLLKSSGISEKNKELIEKICNDLLSQGITEGRVFKYVFILRKIAEWLGKDFEKAKIEDLKRVVGIIQRGPYTEWTKHDYRVILKRFFKWLGKEELVEWIRCGNVKKRRLPEDILTEEEIKKLIDTAIHVRDKALIAVLYESGCRIGEFLSMRIKNIAFDRYGAIAIVNGKTGYRRIRLVSSVPYLTEWMNSHPFRGDPEAFLWISLYNFRRLSYNTLRVLIRNIAEKAGVKKKVNPHAFRHARATHLANHLTEAQMKEFFGWVQDSDMASVYVHLSGRDIDRAILRVYGMGDEEKKEESVLKPKKCLRCGEENPPTNSVCRRCFFPLNGDSKEILEREIQRNLFEEIMDRLWEDREFREMFLCKVRELRRKHIA